MGYQYRMFERRIPDATKLQFKPNLPAPNVETYYHPQKESPRSESTYMQMTRAYCMTKLALQKMGTATLTACTLAERSSAVRWSLTRDLTKQREVHKPDSLLTALFQCI